MRKNVSTVFFLVLIALASSCGGTGGDDVSYLPDTDSSSEETADDQKKSHNLTCHSGSQGNVSGMIQNSVTNAFVSGATVRFSDICGNNKSATTNASGAYNISGLPAGSSYNVQVSRSGYVTLNTTTSVNAFQTNLRSFYITPYYDAAGFVTEDPLDGTDFYPSISFTKTWTIRNNGNTTWNSSYYLEYVSGSLSTSQSQRAISGSVSPGNNYTFSVNMRTPNSSGTYREDWRFRGPGGTINVGGSAVIWASIDVISAPQPNLVPYNHPSWSYPIVPSEVTGTTTVGELSACRTTYVDWAVLNNGNASAGSFRANLYLDGTWIRYTDYNGLTNGYYSAVNDASISATPGNHTLRLVVDANSTVSESNESDNTYERSFFWADCGPSTTISSPSNGATISSSSTTVAGTCSDAGQNLDYVRIRNTTTGWNTTDSGPSGSSSSFSVSGVPLSYGSNTLQATCVDLLGNSGAASITVTRPSLPDLTYLTPSGWPGPIVASAQTGTNSNETLYACRSTYFDFALQNSGVASAGGTFYNHILIDGNYNNQWIKNGLLSGGTDTLIDYSLSSISSGWHTIALNIDATGQIAESSEGNNSVSANFYWNPCNNPVASFSSPVNGFVTTTSPVFVSGTCMDIDGNLSALNIQNSTTGWSSGASIGGSSQSFDVSMPLAIGWNTISATCTDTFSASHTATITVNYDICTDGTLKDNIGNDPCNHNEDGDGRSDSTDTCPLDPDDPIGDPCNHNEDGDGRIDTVDSCPNNPDDAIGDPCNHDEDGDGVLDGEDPCPFSVNDGVGNPCVPNDCPDETQPDAVAQPCNHDEDGDGVADDTDACPFDPNDPVGDPCLHDEDGDGVADVVDACPFSANDAVGDPCNHDEDGDGVMDASDTCPFYTNDTINNICDPNDNSNLIFTGSDIHVSLLQGETNQTEQFVITNGGTGPMTYTFSQDEEANWMGVVKNGGETNALTRTHTLSAGESDRYTVMVASSAAAPEVRIASATLQVTTNDTSDGTASLPVNMSVTAPPYCPVTEELICRVSPSQTLGNNNPNVGNFDDPINTATGNYSYHHTDLTLAGRGLALSFSRTYNSQDNYLGPLGFGWTHTYNIFATELGNGSVQIKWAAGYYETYLRNADGSYSPPTGVFSILSRDNSAGGFILNTKARDTLRFSSQGRLVTLEDRQGNVLTLVYDDRNRLTRVNDMVGNHLAFAYESDDDFKITSVTDSAGRMVRFEYEGDDLTRFTDVRAHVHRYEYEDHRMTRVVEPRGNIAVENSYDELGRVITQKDGKGNTSELDYETPERGQTTITDPLNQTFKQVYDDHLRITESTDASGLAVRYEYDDNNLRKASTNRENRRVEAIYDDQGNLESITDPLGNVTRFEYDLDTDELTKVTEPIGHERHFEYDGEGNLTRIWEELNGETIEKNYTYNDWGQALTSTDPRGHVTRFDYDDRGRLVAITRPDNGVSELTYDSAGRVTTITDPLNRVTTLTYDEAGNSTSIMDTDNHVIRHEYDENGHLVNVTDGKGGVTEYEWNENGLIEIIRNALGDETSILYDVLNRKESITDPENRTIRFDYDTTGNLKSITDLLNRTTTFDYDNEGNLTSRIDTAGKTWVTAYDALGRLTDTTDPLDHNTHYEYDPVMGRLTSVTDAEDHITNYEYDALGRLTAVVDAAEGRTSLEYDLAGNLVKLINVAGLETTFEYDFGGRLEKKTNALNQEEQYFYDLAGELTRFVDGRSQQTLYEYDPHGLISLITYHDGSTVRYTYDANGNRLTRADVLGTASYVYDVLNRRTYFSDPRGFDVGYSYDKSSLLKELTYPGSRVVSYGYNNAGQLEQITDWLNHVTEYVYNNAGRLEKLTYPNSFVTTYDYDDASRLTALVSKKPDNSVLCSYRFTLDGVGNRTAVEKEEPLTPWISPEDVGATYSEENELETFGSLTLDFDDNGNLDIIHSPQGDTDLTFNARDLPSEMTFPSGSTRFAYDGDGNRVALTHAGETTEFVVDSNRAFPDVIAEADGDGNIDRFYIYGLGLVSQVAADGSDFRFYHYDPVGSTIALSDLSGNVTDQYLYDEFGHVNRRIGNTPNLFQYIGQFGVQNDPTGLYYMRARYYDPVAGRFVSKDPIGISEGSNRFAYVNNNPLSFVDPRGLYIDTAIDVVSWGVTLNDLHNDPWDPWNWVAAGADVVTTLLPIAAGGGLAVKGLTRGGKYADEIGQVAGEAISHTDELAQSTAAAGKNSNKIGDAGEDFLHNIAQGERQQSFLNGARVSDEVVGNVLYESKNTFVRMSDDIRRQIDNDYKLLLQGKQPVWQLWRGASDTVKKELSKKGITYVDYLQKSSTIGVPLRLQGNVDFIGPIGAGLMGQTLKDLFSNRDVSGKCGVIMSCAK